MHPAREKKNGESENGGSNESPTETEKAFLRVAHGDLRNATRTPAFLLRFAGWFLLRFAERVFLGLLFQLPPRSTRSRAPVPCRSGAGEAAPPPNPLSDLLDSLAPVSVLRQTDALQIFREPVPNTEPIHAVLRATQRVFSALPVRRVLEPLHQAKQAFLNPIAQREPVGLGESSRALRIPQREIVRPLKDHGIDRLLFAHGIFMVSLSNRLW